MSPTTPTTPATPATPATPTAPTAPTTPGPAARPPITARPRPSAAPLPTTPAVRRAPAATPAAPGVTAGTPSAVPAARPRIEGDWFLLPAPRPEAPVRLFCFPHAGGDATAFTPLARALGPAAEVWALRPPARGGRSRDPMPADFAALTAEVARELAPHLAPGRRAAFYGQSFGALLAHEVARALPADRRPELVVVAGAPSPAEWTERESKDLDAAELLRLTGLEELVSADPELVELALAGIRTDLAVSATYRHHPHPPLTSALYALAGADDPMLATTDLSGWAAHTRGAFDQLVLPGGHLLATVDRSGPVGLLTSLLSGRAAAEPDPGSATASVPATAPATASATVSEEQPSW